MKTCKELGSVLQMIYISQQLWTVISFEEDMLVKLLMEKTHVVQFRPKVSFQYLIVRNFGFMVLY